MILTDFKKGGFPITKRSPVICTLPDGTVKIAYNRYDLSKIIKIDKILSCVGMWPGKKNTDCFTLIPDHYMDAPPEKFKEIDNATEIKTYFYLGEPEDSSLMKITYVLEGVNYETGDKKLMDYINKVGLKHHSCFIKDNKDAP